MCVCVQNKGAGDEAVRNFNSWKSRLQKQSILGSKLKMVCVCVCAHTRVANTSLSTWLWNDKNVCVWANSMILPVLKVACVCVCIPLALVRHATPSRSELCLVTTLCGLYSFLWVCGYVFFFFSPLVTCQ